MRPVASEPDLLGSAAVLVDEPIAETVPKARLLKVGQRRMEPLTTDGDPAAHGLASAQLRFGEALVKASAADPALLPDAMNWLLEAYERGSVQAADTLVRLHSTHCDRPGLRDHWALGCP